MKSLCVAQLVRQVMNEERRQYSDDTTVEPSLKIKLCRHQYSVEPYLNNILTTQLFNIYYFPRKKNFGTGMKLDLALRHKAYHILLLPLPPPKILLVETMY